MDQNAKAHDNWAARWSADRVAKLKELWPIMSASQIGRVMGLTREAVIGKVYRLKLPPKKLDRLLTPKRGGCPPKPVFVPAPRISVPLAPETVLPDMTEPEFLNRRIQDLAIGECHYPRGDQAPYRFCGQPCDGSSWCAYHHRLAYHRVVPARRELADWGVR